MGSHGEHLSQLQLQTSKTCRYCSCSRVHCYSTKILTSLCMHCNLLFLCSSLFASFQKHPKAIRISALTRETWGLRRCDCRSEERRDFTWRFVISWESWESGEAPHCFHISDAWAAWGFVCPPAPEFSRRVRGPKGCTSRWRFSSAQHGGAFCEDCKGMSARKVSHDITREVSQSIPFFLTFVSGMATCPGEAFAASLRLYITTDRAVYAGSSMQMSSDSDTIQHRAGPWRCSCFDGSHCCNWCRLPREEARHKKSEVRRLKFLSSKSLHRQHVCP